MQDPPGFWLVGYEGVYLMHNGKAPDGKQLVVYTRECNPTSMPFDDWWSVKESSGDDGCESSEGLSSAIPLPRKLSSSSLPKPRITLLEGVILPDYRTQPSSLYNATVRHWRAPALKSVLKEKPANQCRKSEPSAIRCDTQQNACQR
jgi:hypothetical protein